MGGRMEIITLKIPRELLDELDVIVSRGAFSSRSEAIRYAISMLISDVYLNGTEVENAAV